MKIIRERFDVEIWPDPMPPPKKTIIQKVKEVDALVPMATDPIDKEVMEAAPKLRIIAQLAVGYENIDIEEATRRGIYVTNTPGVLTEATADLAFALLMAIARGIVEKDKYIRRGEWKVAGHPMLFLGQQIYGATLGIVGLGRIGSAVVRRAKGFGMKVLYYNKEPRPDLEAELGAEYADLNVLLQKSDFVSLHTPLKKETYHMIGERELRLMKKTAFLINTSRGNVVDEKALCRALKEGWIAGAALDVFEREPIPVDNPLLKLDNVIVVPHIGSATYETRSRMTELVAENLIAFFEGKIPPSLVNREVLKTR